MNNAGDVNGLARFRVDPEKVRVAVRRIGGWYARGRLCESGGYLATVGARESTIVHYGRHRYAYRAVVLALLQAEKEQLDGVDLSMSWTFFHPMSTPAQRAHYYQETAR